MHRLPITFTLRPARALQHSTPQLALELGHRVPPKTSCRVTELQGQRTTPCCCFRSFCPLERSKRTLLEESKRALLEELQRPVYIWRPLCACTTLLLYAFCAYASHSSTVARTARRTRADVMARQERWQMQLSCTPLASLFCSSSRSLWM